MNIFIEVSFFEVSFIIKSALIKQALNWFIKVFLHFTLVLLFTFSKPSAAQKLNIIKTWMNRLNIQNKTTEQDQNWNKTGY